MGALRAAVRVARRDAWRNRGRSALIGTMIALPVLAASTLSVVYRTDQLEARDIVAVNLGDEAQARITYTAGTQVEQSPDGQSAMSDGTSVTGPPTSEAEVRAVLTPPSGPASPVGAGT